MTRRRLSVLARLRRPNREACWTWTGARNTNGYGVARIAGRLELVHRFMYEISRGLFGRRLNPSWDVHHRCGNRACANPDHLEALPSLINRGHTAWTRRRTCRTNSR